MYCSTVWHYAQTPCHTGFKQFRICFADYPERMPRTSSTLHLQLSNGPTLTNTLLDTQMSVTLGPTNTFAPCLQQMKTHLWYKDEGHLTNFGY